jgi:hypothetical protein
MQAFERAKTVRAIDRTVTGIGNWQSNERIELSTNCLTTHPTNQTALYLIRNVPYNIVMESVTYAYW